MEEIWKDIKGYEGKYQVSSEGRVRSIGHYGYSSHRIYENRWFEGKILKPYIKGDKIRYSLSQHKYFISVLVAKAFPEICGEWFEGCQVHHKDLNRFNNKADNLICLSKEEHIKLHVEMGWSRTGSNNCWCGKRLPEHVLKASAKKRKKPIIQIDPDGNEIMGWFSSEDCMKETGIDKSSIGRVCLGKQHTAGGYKWRYAS